MSDTKSDRKQCSICSEVKDNIKDFYKGRRQCKKCWNKIRNKSSYTEEERKEMKEGKVITKPIGIMRPQFDQIREQFVKDSTVLTVYALSKKYDIVQTTIHKWRKAGLLEKWQSLILV